MPANGPHIELSPADRRQEVAAVLAKGLARWRRRARAGGFAPAPEIRSKPEISLDLSDESRLSVSDRTAG